MRKKLTVAEARTQIERLKPLQLKCEMDEHGYLFPCPRCGNDRMHRKAVLNALSRYADVYICEVCGTDEALRDMVGEPLPLNEWGMVLPRG